MAYDDKRVAFWILVTVGLSGLAAESAYIGWNVLTQAWGTATSDWRVGEGALATIAYAAGTYGLVFGFAIALRKGPSSWFPHRRPETEPPGLRRLRDWSIPFYLVISTLMILTGPVFLAIWETPRDALVSLLHLYPLVGLWLALGFTIRRAEARGPATASP